ncbi:hypothetical protein Jab_1c14650 [Janthinobacterium sp. HH01]|uniref:DUF971 domain-containing protein n=1 Tax=Janthinobacterium sp. HH01 TaxID=1198452 RepID=UPI0002AEA676|nr:DUF971 domain-containing protein [Janthinobacterium sp. HH01]ELX12850.1 hypothetical protein Jab_1c14650 [Janthinobacterium sp. HH01]
MEAAIHPSTLVNNRQGRMLDIVWDDGQTQHLPHALLRAQCKCTVCQSQRLLAGAAQAAPEADVRIDEIRQVGAYGVQLIFSDKHERGIYPWTYLRSLASET